MGSFFVTSKVLLLGLRFARAASVTESSLRTLHSTTTRPRAERLARAPLFSRIARDASRVRRRRRSTQVTRVRRPVTRAGQVTREVTREVTSEVAVLSSVTANTLVAFHSLG